MASAKRNCMKPITSVEGPVELIDGEHVAYPLEVGGGMLIESSRGIGEVEGEFLKVDVSAWLAEKLGFTNSSIVTVDNADRKFNLRLRDSESTDHSPSG